MASVISLVLGGGRGDRLYPLTKHRSKPAVPLGGKYRLIDIPISNCINSGLNRIYILTQFNSVSLHRHISNTYKFDVFSRGFVEILAAQQTLSGASWYQGTADAVRQNLQRVEDEHTEHVLILSGDQLYRMHLGDMLRTHLETKADITICGLVVPPEKVGSFGVLRADAKGRVIAFEEKPKDPEALRRMRTDAEWMAARGVEARGREHLANMGIYLFKTEVLLKLLVATTDQDFGREVFPHSVGSHHVAVHLFDGYWEDIGTIKSFHQANIQLAAAEPSFDFHTPEGVIYSRARFLPASRVLGATVEESLIADGCVIGAGSTIKQSVVGVRSRIGRGVRLGQTVLMGTDFFETAAERRRNRELGQPDCGIGEGSRIERAIIDKNCRIGRNVQIVNAEGVENSEETEHFMIRDGVVVIAKGTSIPDNTVI